MLTKIVTGEEVNRGKNLEQPSLLSTSSKKLDAILKFEVNLC